MSFQGNPGTYFLQPRFGEFPTGFEGPKLPERVVLTESEQQEALAFEHQLFDLPLGIDESEDGIKERTIGDALTDFKLDDRQCPPFFLGYFLQNNDITVKNGDGETYVAPRLDTEEDVKRWISQSATTNLPKGVLQSLAKKSQDFFANQAIERLVQGNEDPIDDRYNLINIDPATTVTQLHDYLRARNILKRESVLLSEDASNLGNAKRAILEIYTAKVNNCIADYLPRAARIVEQAQYDRDGYEPLLSEMIKAMPKTLAWLILEGVDRRSLLQRFEHRLDLLRNGLANAPSKLSSAVAAELVDYTPATAEQSQPVEPLFSEEEIGILKKTIISPENGELFIRALLDKKGYHDWPVVPNPNKTTYEVSRSNRKFLNSTVDRSAWQLLVVGMIHEPIHVEQKVNDDSLADVIKIASVGGKRSGGIREEGAMSEQRSVEDIFMGEQIRRPNLQYARAIHVLQQGGGPICAVERFVDNDLPDADKVRAAVDRVIRLIRKGENTQPMVYAEGYLLNKSLQSLEQQYPEVGVNHTTFDIPDQLRLARFGLLPETTANHSTLLRAATALSVVGEILLEHPELHELDELRSIDWSRKATQLGLLE